MFYLTIELSLHQTPLAITDRQTMTTSHNHRVASSRRVAIIVPYYQREAQILRRCLASIFAQKTDPTIRMHVIIVDDTSPWPAREELHDIEIPEQITVEVITRINGGPGAARNSGLDHVPRATEYIAFIDSDDTWRDDHIQRALDSLGTSNDLYFSDYLRWDGFSNLGASQFGALVGRDSTARVPGMNGVWVYFNEELIPHAAKEFLTHSSALVFRQETLSICRFNEDLWYGEDYLFFFDLLSFSSRTCISTQTEVELGLGVNLYFSSWSWDSTSNIRRRCYDLIAYKRVRRRCRFRPDLYRLLTQTIRGYRLALAFFFLRQLSKGPAVDHCLALLLREDPLFFAAFPVYALRAASQWIRGKKHGKPAFHGK
jgi:succinoglycan biosynthesis protein ExoW